VTLRVGAGNFTFIDDIRRIDIAVMISDGFLSAPRNSLPPKILFLSIVIHKNLLQQRIRLLLSSKSAFPLPTPQKSHLPSTYHAQPPRQTPTSPPRSTHNISIQRLSVTYNRPTLKVTTNPVSHTLSRFTFVRFNGVFNGFPPFGMLRIRS
jgi:hypothetical protein